MNTIEEQLKSLILSRYKSIREFTTTIGMPYSTMDSVLKRGVKKAGISTIFTICKELQIDTTKLIEGSIESTASAHTVAAHKEDGEQWTDEELKKIEDYKKLLLAARNTQNEL